MAIRKICPNCSGELELYKDRYVCESCGSTFAVDHDVQDVERARQETAAEREAAQRLRAQEINSTKQELEQQAKANDARRSRNSNKKAILRLAILITAPMVAFYTIMYILAFAGMITKNVASKSEKTKTEVEETENEERASRVPVDASLIQEDEEALEKFLASAEYEMKYNNQGKLVFEDPEITVISTGEYELEDVFVLSTDKTDRLFFVYNAVFEDEETGEKYDVCCPVDFGIHRDANEEDGFRLDFEPSTTKIYDKEREIHVHDKESFYRFVVEKDNVVAKVDIDLPNS